MSQENEKIFTAIERADTWSSVLTGMGVTGKDKMGNLQATWQPLPSAMAEQIYAADDVAKRVVNELVDDACREWIKFKGEQSVIDLFSAEFERLQIQQNFAEAWKQARATGGSGLLIVTDTPTDMWIYPLMPEFERNIKSVILFSRSELFSYKFETDIGNQRFGLPLTYQLQPIAMSQATLLEVHWTRVIRFDGEPLMRRQFVQNNYWHDSVLNSTRAAIRNYNGAHLYSSEAIADFSVSMMKIKNLAELIASGKGGMIVERAQIVNMCKAIGRMVVVDQDEDIINVSRNVAGLSDLVSCAENRLVVATHMPRTKILGEAPKGLSPSGDADERQWYDRVARQQEQVLAPRLNALLDMMQKFKNGVTNGERVDISYDFEPLWQMSVPEQAEAYFKTAQADALYITNQVLDPQEVRQRFSGENFDMNVTVDPEDMPEPDEEEEVEPSVEETAAIDEIKNDAADELKKKLIVESAETGFIVRMDGKVIGKYSDRNRAEKVLATILKLSKKKKG